MKKEINDDIKNISTKQKLLDISEDLFLKKDFEEVSIDEICNAAGVTKGSFYHHFTSKYDIPIQQYRRIQDRFYKDYEATYCYSAKHRLRFAIMWYAHYCKPNNLNVFKNYYKVMINSSKNKVMRRIEIETRIFTEIINFGMGVGTFNKTMEPAYVSEMITRFILSLLLDWAIFNGNMELEHELDSLYDFIMAMLSPQKSS